MKKILLILIVLIITTGCKKETKLKKLEPNREERIMLTCSLDKEITYMFYFEEEDKPYYKAVYLEKKIFNSDEEAEEYQEAFLNIWFERYADHLITLEYRVNENTSFINVTASRDTEEELYKDFFGDRYNLDMDDMNKIFDNECLIKTIKK